MAITLIAICAAVLLIVLWTKRTRDRKELEQHSITPEALHSLLASNPDIHVYDVRQPLDLFVDAEIIPGATRLAPKDVLENPSLIPSDIDSIIYCTCPSDKTSRAILQQALGLHFFRIKFLKGGLGSWKAKGYPVEPYEEPIQLDTGT
ncbi:MAG TPA: rhodanese-like domain-containing protein [Acidobacteriaceae bacterium]|jgi:rhodanese-related sulfurtransferase|nr:rhodanese-like domain-containing protein [Acidobacteriaceae bacterium]